MGNSKAEGRPVREIESNLGFWWPRGISRQGGRCEVPVIKTLLEKIVPVIREHSGLHVEDIKRSEELKAQANSIFDEMGQSLWPDPPVPRSPWLIPNARVNNLGGLYPRDLYFSNEEDQVELRKHFHELLVRKAQHRHKNDLIAQSKGRTPAGNTSSAISSVERDWETGREIIDDSLRQRIPPAAFMGDGPWSSSPPAEDHSAISEPDHHQSSSPDRDVSFGSTESHISVKRKRTLSDVSVAGVLVVVLKLPPKTLEEVEARWSSQGQAIHSILSGVAGDDGVRDTMSNDLVYHDLDGMPALSEGAESSTCVFGQTAQHDRNQSDFGTNAQTSMPPGEQTGDTGRENSEPADRGLLGTADHGRSDSCVGRESDDVLDDIPGDAISVNAGGSVLRTSQSQPFAEARKSQSPSQPGSSAATLTVASHIEPPPAEAVTGSRQSPSIPLNLFEDIQVEIDWNRGVSPDYMILEHDRETVEQFFKLLEDQLPPELEADRNDIKQVRVKVVNQQATGLLAKIDCRIPRSPLGRASLRQMFRKLKVPREGGEPPELSIQVDWKT